MTIIRRISNWYFSKAALPYWCILVIDCTIVAASSYIGCYLSRGGDMLASLFWPLTYGIAIGMVPFIIAFRALHTYSGIVRYSSFVDLQKVATATFIGTLTCYFLHLVVNEAWGQTAIVFPSLKSSLIIFISSTVLLWAERIVVKRLFDSFHLDGATPAAIYGTKAGGISIAKSIVALKDKKYSLDSFISDGEEMRGSFIMGKPVFLNHKGIAKELKNRGVKALLVSPLKTEKFRQNSAMVDEFIDADIKIMMMTYGTEWNGDESSLSHKQLHAVDIEDLLPRDKIEVNMAEIEKQLRGKRILITGAAGSIGSEIVRQVAQFGPAEMTLIDQAETPMHDIRMMMARRFPNIKNETIVSSIANKEHMEKIFEAHRPEYVFHAAAYKHVPMMEDDPAKRMIALSGATDVEIKFTGLRDGEKLYEEVLNDKEGTIPTSNPKIMVAKVREYDYATACANEERLLEVSKSFDDMAIVRVMKDIVPEYKSRQSKYEVLDN